MARGAIPGVSRVMADVLVVGPSPVGLTVAAKLVCHGCGCRIIDCLEAASGYCKALYRRPRAAVR
jgi:hypothetical protein